MSESQRHFDIGDPGDDLFFLSSPEEVDMFSWRATSSMKIDREQMRAIGRLVSLGMTDNAKGYQASPQRESGSWLVDNEDLGEMAERLSRNLSTVLRRKVTTYWTHFVTHTPETGHSRDNIILAFYPKLVFEGVPVTFHFDRLVTIEDLIETGD